MHEDNAESKKVEEGFREALRKVNSKNDKMIELMKFDNKEKPEPGDKDSANKDLSSLNNNDIINYTEGNRLEFLSNSRTEFEKDIGSEVSQNFRAINKNYTLKKKDSKLDKASGGNKPILSKLRGKNN
jgi:hypothetical protein